MADKIEDKVKPKQIKPSGNLNTQSLTSLIRAWKEGRISGKSTLTQISKKLLEKKKGGAVKKYSHGGSVSSGHQLTYKRK